MNTKKIHLKSFGCQMNKLDSSLLAAALTEKGWEMTDSASEADVVIINTCSVRDHAEQRVLSHLGHLQHLKKSRPHLLVAVIGCMAQRLGSRLLEHPTVDIAAGPEQLHQVPQLIQEALGDRRKHLAVTEAIRRPAGTKERLELNEELDEFERTYDSDRNHLKSQAFIRVMRGCNNFCSFCIVPYVRGPEISRPPKAILEQAQKLAAQGIRQITLLGQTINSYRYSEGGRTYTLADLLEMVSQIDELRWIRFITSHPAKMEDSILEAMARLPKVCPYLHIPAQSGSDRILKAMHRGYTAQQYLALIEKAKAIVPNLALTGDFIVGFPGETEEDFQATVELVQKVRYKNCFIFKYSPRPGTRAQEHLEDTIPAEVKQQRNYQLLEIVNQIAEEDNRRFLGQIVEVLTEGPSKKPHLNQADGRPQPQLIGRTADDYIVVFNGPETLSGRFVKVKITKTAALTLFGESVTD
ncbi:MAG TPA: tRNA (N6-isopentenyl adenosine(37)-C2)-methylthiotransferase MiaB [Anaerohalosphaeraceae bacterium]|nr:tRNA (N6-isopentenyl adenosine(37)-C2)-methylthiotransferase MiaB [Anaerohalosphaeraceae bacterium]HPB93305.1 tRNA (N6-isopentenyl adenosine(37)-C2)-methylthiotransferase MiaB [Anaerohalosphaeraceae bacterium]HRT24085.1 tRNA (N6-isopentenyl adenosine(37)-C2)-methylthiotransferase MiaB [Anaerohalosphaeraceae bacterium]